MNPVSYTHLDVYKRQVYLCASEDFKAKSESKIALDAYKEVDVYPPQKAPAAPVSYTHLVAATAHLDGPQWTGIFTHTAGDAPRLIYGGQFL